MACTKTTAVQKLGVPWTLTYVDCSVLQPGLPEDITHLGSTGCSPDWVTHEVRAPATSGDPVFVSRIPASDVPASRTARVLFDTIAGGDLAGMIVRVFFHFMPASSGGLSNVA